MDSKEKKRIGVVVLSAVWILVSIGLYRAAGAFPTGRGGVGSTYGSAFFPRIMLGVIALTSLALVIKTAFKRDIVGATGQLNIGFSEIARPAAIWLLSLGFYFAWNEFGFVVSSIVYLISVVLVMKERSVIAIAGVAAVGPVLFLVFERLLRVGL